MDYGTWGAIAGILAAVVMALYTISLHRRLGRAEMERDLWIDIAVLAGNDRDRQLARADAFKQRADRALEGWGSLLGDFGGLLGEFEELAEEYAALGRKYITLLLSTPPASPLSPVMSSGFAPVEMGGFEPGGLYSPSFGFDFEADEPCTCGLIGCPSNGAGALPFEFDELEAFTAPLLIDYGYAEPAQTVEIVIREELDITIRLEIVERPATAAEMYAALAAMGRLV